MKDQLKFNHHKSGNEDELLFHHQPSQVCTVGFGSKHQRLDRAGYASEIIRQPTHVAAKDTRPLSSQVLLDLWIVTSLRCDEFIVPLVQQTLNGAVPCRREDVIPINRQRRDAIARY